jgi:dihydropyrimidinase
LLFSEGVRRGRISLNRFVEVCSTLPAKLFGLYPRKGTIIIGSDADIVIFNPDKEVTLSCKDLHQNVDYCPFEGWRVRGYPDIVIAKGKVIFREGEFVGEVGAGEFLERI